MRLNQLKSFPLFHLHAALFIGMFRTRVERNRGPHLCVDLWVSCGSGVRGRGSDVQSVV